MNAPVIPVFNVVPEEEAFRESFANLKKGDGNYSFADVCHVSNWIGICAFTYLTDKYCKHTKLDFDPKMVSTQFLYYLQCGHVTNITHNILKRALIPHNYCYTREPCQQLLSHSSVISRFQPMEGQVDIHYDHSLRQYFKTNEDGILQIPERANRTSDYVSKHLMNDAVSQRMSIDLIATGSTQVGDEDLVAYVDAFAKSVRDSHIHFNENLYTPEERTAMFILDDNNGFEKKYAPWSVFPGEKAAKQLLNRYEAIWKMIP